MRVSVLYPGDRDVGAAPAATRYLDSRLGNDDWNGAAPAPGAPGVGPKRTANGFGTSLAAGQTIAVRRGGEYGPPSMPLAAGTAADTLVFSGTSGNRAKVIAWGSGDPPMVVGSAPAASLWGPVSDSGGNNYLAANGEQSAPFPTWCTLMHYPAQGRECYTPSVWHPNIGPILGDICRREYFIPRPDYELGYLASSVQDFISSISQAMVPDFSREIAYEAAAGSADVAVHWTHPAIGSFFANDPPLGAWVTAVTQPSNRQRFGFVQAVDLQANRITWLFPGESQRIRLSGVFALLGARAALRQPGQFAIRRAQPTDQPVYFLVQGDWMKGPRRHMVRRRVFRVEGSWWEISGLSFAQGGNMPGESSGGIFSFQQSNNFILDGTGCEISWFNSITLGRAMDDDAGTQEDGEIRGFEFDNMVFGGGVKAGPHRRVTCDGLRFFTVGDTCLSSNTNSAGPHGLVWRNCEAHHVNTTHGNGLNFYDNVNDCLEEKSILLDRNLNWTHQGAAGMTVPRLIIRRASILQAARGINLQPEAQGNRQSGDTLRFGYGGNGCTLDRVWVPRASSAGLMVGVYNGPPNPEERFDNAVVSRCAIDGVNISTGSGQPYMGGNPLLLRDVISTRLPGATANTSLAGWSSVGGATVQRARQIDGGLYNGSMSFDEWEMMSRTDPFDPLNPTYQAFQLGPDRVDWQFPAYNAQHDVGALVDLVMTRYWFNAGTQPGKALCAVLRARPGSTLRIDPNYGDGGSLLLDLGMIIPLQRFRRDVTFRVGELRHDLSDTPANWRWTVVTLEVRQ
ncbi:MAG: hypothetical protein ACK4Z0_05750 [Sphingomonadaceae bacterium]